MDTVSIFNFCLSIFDGFSSMVSVVISWVGTSITINDVDYPIISLLFGSGIIIYFGVMIVKWLI